ncbi:HNH endonuclease [Roseateles sp. L2-2]|uniref:HNH endonuclease n=1 Tax=Roseateles sp. L2-2 TaxID=3422597 RepID=UPI003D3620FE
MALANRHGLTRHIPAEIKREVRQRCGFGCVICGLGFYDYEHFAPDYADATAHHPEGITLLCPNCNQKRARGTLSRQTVAAADQNPACLQRGFTREYLDVSPDRLILRFAAATFVNCPVAVEVNRFPILSIARPASPGEPLRLSGHFCDAQGRVTLMIRDNEWRAPKDVWDVECRGPRITIRTGRGDIALALRTEPPERLVIERISMGFEGCLIQGTEDEMRLSVDGGRGWSTIQRAHVEDCAIGFSLANSERYKNSNDLRF